jgi:hypothetical protein
MSEATRLTGEFYQNGFIEGFGEQNRDVFDVLAQGCVYVDPETKNDRGDIDFAVRIRTGKALSDLFGKQPYITTKGMESIIIPAGTQIFFELTAMDGKGVVKSKKSQKSRLEAKHAFYRDFVLGILEAKEPGAPVWRDGDIVIFAYNGADHVSIEEEVEELSSQFMFVPVWMRKEAVAAWAPTVGIERLQEREREMQEREIERERERERERQERERERQETERERQERERERERERESARAAIKSLLKGKSEEEIENYLASVGLA